MKDYNFMKVYLNITLSGHKQEMKEEVGEDGSVNDELKEEEDDNVMNEEL